MVVLIFDVFTDQTAGITIKHSLALNHVVWFIKCKEKLCREQNICLIDFLSPTHCHADG